MNDFLFQDDEVEQKTETNKHDAEKHWRILVVDDDASIHQITKLVLADIEIEQRKLELVCAYSSIEAKEILRKDNDFCMAFVDVVMETEHAGLELVDWIRNEHKNHSIRLILRTGQAGSAPEAKVIKDFDINDYKEKTDFTSSKMITTVYAAIRAYRDIVTIQRSLDAFKQLISATHDLLKINQIKPFGSAALNHLLTLMNIESSALYIARTHIDFAQANHHRILACTGKYVCESDSLEAANIDTKVKQRIGQVFESKTHYHDEHCFVGYYQTNYDACSVLYVEFEEQADHFRTHLVELYATNVALILEGLTRQHEIEKTQKELMYIVGEAIESKSSSIGKHVQRVANLCCLMAEKLGLDEKYVQALRIAAPLHDLGKVAIPDEILNKPGKLAADEWKVMQNHAELGATMLSKSTSSISKLSASLAKYHHENWDGSGYPSGLSTDNIPLEARIMAVVDVFDALGSNRCYKKAWQHEQIKEFFTTQRGVKFDPKLVDVLLEHYHEFAQVRDNYPDNNDET